MRQHRAAHRADKSIILRKRRCTASPSAGVDLACIGRLLSGDRMIAAASRILLTEARLDRRTFTVSLLAAALIAPKSFANPVYIGGDVRPTLVPGTPPRMNFGHALLVPD